jgi:D-3-phosphoglycerate dehydrogenase / 2-oxoglutarate reductase
VARFKVVMTDCIFPDQDIERGELAAIDAELVLASGTDAETLAREARDCDALLNVYAQVPAEVIGSLERCKVIVRTGIGINTIDLDAANSKGIMVANVPDYCQDEVADHTMALFLALSRKLIHLNGEVRNSNWSFAGAKPIERLSVGTFGLFGLGSIAQGVARRAKSFGMKVIAYDPFIPAEVFAAHGVERVEDFDRLLAEADVLSLHAPLTDETHHIINGEALAKMKPGAYLVNTSRGPLIDEDALFRALSDGIIAGAGLDVLADEPPTFPVALLTLANVIVTPHAAFYSEQSNDELRSKSAKEIARTLIDGEPAHWVNRPRS